MIKLKNLHKSFGDIEVLKGIDLEVKKGEVVSIIGPSGTGKSTLLRCINYLDKPQEGKLIIDDYQVDFKSINKKEVYKLRTKTSMVFQNYNLFNNMTVIENIMEPMTYVKKMNKQESETCANDLLKRIGLQDKRDVYPSKLSGGQQQRVGIARAMAVSPEVILFDEPTSALDPELVGEVLQVIEELAKENITMMIVTHEMDFARHISDKIIFLDDGKIAEQGSPEEVFLNPKNVRTEKFLAKVNMKNR